MRDITTLSDEFLRTMLDLCPDGKSVTKVEFRANGKTVTLTAETRARVVAELARRKGPPKPSKEAPRNVQRKRPTGLFGDDARYV